MKRLAAVLLFCLAACPVFAQQLVSPSQCVSIAIAGGTPDAITIPKLPCTATSTLLLLTATAPNTTTTPTIKVTGSGVPPQTIKRYTGDPVQPGDIPGAGSHLLMTNNGSNWILMAPGLGIGSGVFGPVASGQDKAAFWNNTFGTLLSTSPLHGSNFIKTPSVGGWYDGDINASMMGAVMGSQASPNTTVNSVITIQKIGSQNTNAAANPALYASLVATNGGQSSHGTGIMGAIRDPIGYTGTPGPSNGVFYEGVRGQCDILATAVSGFCEGVVAEVEALFGSTYRGTIGMEAAVNNYTGIDAPDNFDDLTLSVGFLASCDDHGGMDPHVAKCGQAFQVNQNNPVPWRFGFFVPPGNSVDTTSFYSAATAHIGLDLANGTNDVAAIRIPNGGLIMSFDHTGPVGAVNLRLLSTNGFDQLVLGDDSNLDAIIVGTTGVPLLLNNPAIVLNNNVPIQAYNAAGTTQLQLLSLNALDQIVLGQQATVSGIAIGNISGATPTALNSAGITAPNLPTAGSGKCLGIDTTTKLIYVSTTNCT
jgi:hypothetical protein